MKTRGHCEIDEKSSMEQCPFLCGKRNKRVFQNDCGKPAIVKATTSGIRISDQYNQLICRHKQSHKDYPLYVTEDSHMRPEHLY